MCGIAGIIDLKNRPQRETLDRMLEAIRHRGPDAEGTLVDEKVALGHVRLSILDLSTDANQPMTRGDISIIFNGEIYNFVELRQELQSRFGHCFSTTSDTEVILAAYSRWGMGAVQRFRGMWAFALYDAGKHQLWLSRDRFGIKPLYYSRTGDRLCFGSEIKALLAANVCVVPDLQEIATFLVSGLTDYGERTFFSGITQLPAGHNLTVSLNSGRVSVQRYYDLHSAVQEKTANADFRTTLEESVQLHLRSDVPVGTCLSGGLDSSTIAAIAAPLCSAKTRVPMTGITAASRDRNDETQFARAVIEHLNMHWIVVHPTEGDFRQRFRNILRHQEQPTGSASVLMQDMVMQAARQQGLKVLLDGQGGDEILFGYERYFAAQYQEHAASGSWLKLARDIASAARNSRLSMLDAIVSGLYFNSVALRRARLQYGARTVRKELRDAAIETAAARFRSETSALALQCKEITSFQLPHLLRFEDRSSMAHSIEARVPLVDHVLVEMAVALSIDEKIKDGWTKYPLRLVASNLLPREIAWRKTKVGFAAPEDISSKSSREMEEMASKSHLCRELFSGAPNRHGSLSASMRFRRFEIALWEDIFLRNTDVAIPVQKKTPGAFLLAN